MVIAKLKNSTDIDLHFRYFEKKETFLKSKYMISVHSHMYLPLIQVHLMTTLSLRIPSR